MFGRLTKEQWRTYAFFLAYMGKNFASNWKHDTICENVKFGRTLTNENKWKVAFSDDDSTTTKRFFPRHFSEDEWENLIDDEWIHGGSILYDCTGEVFTCYIDRFETTTGTWVYHKTSIDF